MKVSALHAPGSWLFGTIVALVLREALTQAVPHIIDSTSHLHTGPDNRALWLESTRLCAVLIVTVRFYLGSVEFFDKAHLDNRATNETYAVDFVFGFFHFLIFVAWAATIEVSPMMMQQRFGGPFLDLLGFILFFDTPWCIVRRRGRHHDMAVLWSVMNLATLLLCVATYLIGMNYEPDRPDLWEKVVLVIVMVISFVDIWGILRDDPIFPKWIRALLPPKEEEAVAS